MTIRGEGCDAVGDLLGAFALDALDGDEAAAVAAHVASCPRCAQEVDQHRETASMLGAAGGDAPARVWDRIATAIETAPSRARPQQAPLLLRPAPARPGRRRTVRAVAAAFAVAAAVVIGVLAVRVSHLDHRVGQLATAAQAQGGPAAALLDPSAKHLTLTATEPGHRQLGRLVILPSGAAYMVDATVPALPASRTYQLWSLIHGKAISVGVLGNQPRTVAFTVDPASTPAAFLVTVEPAGGVITPTSAPVAEAST